MGKPTRNKKQKHSKLKAKPPAPPAQAASPPAPAQPGSLQGRIANYVRAVPVTATILAINGLVFLAGVVLGVELEILTWGASERSSIWGGEYWRLVTPIALHAGVFHWLVNTYALFLIGTVVERDLGRMRFALLYLAAGMSGVALSVLGNDVLSVGASGAILGLFGAALTIKLFQPYSLFARVEWRFFLINGVLLGGITLMGFAGLPIDNLAHLGGFVMGLMLGSVFALSRHPQQSPGRLNVLWGLAGLLLLVTASLSAAATHRWPGMQSRVAMTEQVKQADAAAQRDDAEAVLAHLEQAEDFDELPPNGLFLRSHALIRLGRNDEARNEIQRLLDHPHGELYGLFARAILHEYQGDRAAAIADLETVLDIAPPEWAQTDDIRHYLSELRQRPQTQPDDESR